MAGFVAIAKIVKTRGIRGELTAELLTDFPQRFASVGEVRIVTQEGVYRETLEHHWFHKGRVILKFKGLERPHHAKHLVGGQVEVPEKERFQPPADTFFHSDLVGCRVVEEGHSLGQVSEILETGSEGANLVVQTPHHGEVLIPLVRKFVKEIDLSGRRIDVNLPDGLLQLGLKEKKRESE